MSATHVELVNLIPPALRLHVQFFTRFCTTDKHVANEKAAMITMMIDADPSNRDLDHQRLGYNDRDHVGTIINQYTQSAVNTTI